MSDPKDGTVIDAPGINLGGEECRAIYSKGRWVLQAFNRGGWSSTAVDLKALREFCTEHGIWQETCEDVTPSGHRCQHPKGHNGQHVHEIDGGGTFTWEEF